MGLENVERELKTKTFKKHPIKGLLSKFSEIKRAGTVESGLQKRVEL